MTTIIARPRNVCIQPATGANERTGARRRPSACPPLTQAVSRLIPPLKRRHQATFLHYAACSYLRSLCALTLIDAAQWAFGLVTSRLVNMKNEYTAFSEISIKMCEIYKNELQAGTTRQLKKG